MLRHKNLVTKLDGAMAIEMLCNAPDPMLIVDCSQNIVFTNSQLETVFGYSADDLVGRPVRELVPPRFRQSHDECVMRFFEAPTKRGMGPKRELYVLTKDGREVPAEIRLSTVGTGPERLAVASVQEVSEQRRIRLEFENVNRRLGQQTAQLEAIVRDLRVFAQTVSHDLQAPLRQISQFLTLLDRNEGDRLSEDSRGYLSAATMSSVRLTHMIQDVLAYSRIGISTERFQATSLDRALDEVIVSMSRLLEEQHATVTYSGLPTVMADRMQVMQLFQNLITNALVHRGEQPPQIQITGSVEGDQCVLAVEDNGPGIDPRHHEKIFEMFQRPGSADGRPGAGVGLAICKRIVERHQGTLRVESSPGKGARFIFTLPRSDIDQPMN